MVGHFCHVIWNSADWYLQWSVRGLTKVYQAEWCPASRSVYLYVVSKFQQLPIVVSLSVLLYDVVSEACIECSDEPFHLFMDLEVIVSFCQVLTSQSCNSGCEEL